MIRLALVVVALLLGALSAAAEEACETWTAGAQEDEGGLVFTVAACATDRPDAYLFLTCSAGEVFLRYDLAVGPSAPRMKTRSTMSISPSVSPRSGCRCAMKRWTACSREASRATDR
jgi:hypothetical protein